MKEPWQIVSYRLQQWKGFLPAPLCSVSGCRARNVYHESNRPDIRRTPLGDCCISCWLDWEACEVCGHGAALPGTTFRGQHVCAECLLTPEIPDSAWHDWILYYVYAPRSAFVQILEDAFAEDFRRAAPTPRRFSEWHLTTVLA